jgi:hypothetical protein
MSAEIAREALEERPQRRRSPAMALVYASILPYLQRKARECGYALALHGSMATDFDLIAVPWTEEAIEAPILIETLREAVGGIIEGTQEGHPNPVSKPHGRLAWVIYFRETEVGWGPYLDISVMPRHKPEVG